MASHADRRMYVFSNIENAVKFVDKICMTPKGNANIISCLQAKKLDGLSMHQIDMLYMLMIESHDEK
jgi:hypothetical protein